MASSQVPAKTVSLADIPWDSTADVFGHRRRCQRLSYAAAGANTHLDVVVEELRPGESDGAARYSLFGEEHLFILEGTVSLVLGGSDYSLGVGDYICLSAGRPLAHQLFNASAASCRIVRVREQLPHEIIVDVEHRKMFLQHLGRATRFEIPPGVEFNEASKFPPLKPPVVSASLPWKDSPINDQFVDRNKHLTYYSVGTKYRVGVLIEGPPPGKRMAPQHYHMLEEEHALILEGEVTLLFGDERIIMTAGDYVCFPAGQKIGHSFLNSGTGPCSYLMIGERNAADVCVLPQSNKMDVRAIGEHGVFFDMAARRDYLDGES